MQEINDQSMLRVGTILRGIYRIDSYLSSGGFGNTYVVTNIEFDEKYAIKEFFMKGVTQRDSNQTTVSVSNTENRNAFAEQKEKFKKEARRLRQLKNPHIVSVHDLFEENGTAYYVMDFIDGENLGERLKRTGKPMTETEVSQILPQILEALQAVHKAGMWHLDLKPANTMVDKSGNVKLIDFGASKQLNAQKGGATTSTAISYTNGYAPREQMEQNYDKFGPWTDLYALGATLYNLLTNKRPPLPTDIDDDMSEDKHLSLPMPNVSEQMKKLVLWLMKTNRLQRPKDIHAVKELKDEAKLKATPPPIPIVTKEANEEETIIASKKEEPKKNQYTAPTPPPQKENVATQNNNDDNSNNHSWLWVLLVGFLIVGLLWLLGTCDSNFSSEPVNVEEIDTLAILTEEANAAAEEMISYLVNSIETKDLTAFQCALEAVKTKIAEFIGMNPEVALIYIRKVQIFLYDNADLIMAFVGTNATISGLLDSIANIPNESVDKLLGASEALGALGIDIKR
mgnify:CR=1 FL=1